MKNLLNVLLILCCFFPVTAFADSFSELSSKTNYLDQGFSIQQAVALLGEPTWAVTSDDSGRFSIGKKGAALALYWNNPGCGPVIVFFDKNHTVTAWDEGTDFCGAGAEDFNPTDQYNCTNPDRIILCK
ncbi:MAG: hypothetical protein KKE17_08020 [Proteobacteria bacterium]|nr:hypothetical protein [Pseudomonadota bacterium]MBU1709933.1 hypothetical protein [Pseudomonadota bacterium]